MTLPAILVSATRKASWLNRIRAFCKSLTPLPSASITFRRTPDGTIYEVKQVAAPGSGATVKQFKITSIANSDYLVCRTWDGTTLGDADVNVAKPYTLRQGPFHGKTLNGIAYSYLTSQRRSLTHATLASATSEEVVTPPYAVDDQILAVEPKGGPTGGYVTSSLAAATWEDTNSLGRVWLPPYVVLEVCINGVARKMVFRAGPNDFA